VSALYSPKQFIDFKLERGAFPVLCVLNDEDHQHANDIRDRIDDQLPSVTPVKNRSGHKPNESQTPPGGAGGLMSWAASKAVGGFI
jgi:hypothetical protein